MDPLDMLAIILIVLVAFNWYVAWVTNKADTRPRIPALHERAIAATVLAVIATCWGLLALVALEILPPEVVLPVMVIAALATSIPAAYWLYQNHKGW